MGVNRMQNFQLSHDPKLLRRIQNFNFPMTPGCFGYLISMAKSSLPFLLNISCKGFLSTFEDVIAIIFSLFSFVLEFLESETFLISRR